jgi:hypothetical protein
LYCNSSWTAAIRRNYCVELVSELFRQEIMDSGQVVTIINLKACSTEVTVLRVSGWRLVQVQRVSFLPCGPNDRAQYNSMRDANGYLFEEQWLDGPGTHPAQTRYRTAVTTRDGEPVLTVDIDLWEADYVFGGPPTGNEHWATYLQRLALELAFEEIGSGLMRKVLCTLGPGGRCHHVGYD